LSACLQYDACMQRWRLSVYNYIPVCTLHRQSAWLSLPSGELDPDEQSEHSAEPEKFLYFPISHVWQEVLARVQPALHAQNLSVVAPAKAEYAPAPQFWHALTPVKLLYVPKRHRLQASEELAPVVPRNVPTEHSLQTVADARRAYLPGAHVAQARVPIASVYVPGAQAVHGPPLGPENPEKQEHKDAPLRLVENFGQSSHGQSWHKENGLNLPGAHSSQSG